MIYTPHPYQQAAEQHLFTHRYACLFLDMGMGKTVVTLTVLNVLRLVDANKILVIAPLSVANNVWKQEATKWQHLQGLQVSIVTGDEKKRFAALKSKADVHVINRDLVPWLVRFYGAAWPFDTVVLDELSSFKNSNSQRFRALKAVRPRLRRVIGLTGTPTPNSLLDLWPQMYLIDKGERLGQFVTHYRSRYFDNYGYTYTIKKGAADEIHGKIKDLCLSMSAKDYLSLPQYIENTVELDLPNAKEYKEFERDMVLSLCDGDDVTAANAAVLVGKLLQMASGAVYTESGDTHEVHNAKINATADYIEALQGEPLLLLYQYKHSLARIMQRIKDVTPFTGRPEQIVEWNRGCIPVLAAHPASCGHGLNLQHGGHNVLWFTSSWSLELDQQANARVYRQGQTKPVVVGRLVMRDTADLDVLKALKNKDVGQQALLKAVSYIIKRHENRPKQL